MKNEAETKDKECRAPRAIRGCKGEDPQLIFHVVAQHIHATEISARVTWPLGSLKARKKRGTA
jgi:hypothetical protein